MSAIYDRIGTSYSSTRRPDPRIAAMIDGALDDCESVLNVGAGTGSYEPRDRTVVAVEVSEVMIRQRSHAAPPAVMATAEQLPFPDRAFDAAMAVLTVHHWADKAKGLRELRRVAAGRAVVLTWDQRVWESFWLVRDYLPCIRDIDRRRAIPIDEICAELGGGDVVPVCIPHDCVDGFHGAYWRRPHAYLDPTIRAGMSTYALMQPAERDEGLARLAHDLESGSWDARHADLLSSDEIDLGYRLIVARAGRGGS